MITAMLITLLASSVALAADVTLALNPETACPGDNVTASGAADAATWVSVKIIDSVGTIVFFDATMSDSSGNYRLDFKVPSVSSDTLIVVAGYGENVANKKLTVIESKEPTPGGSTGGGGAAIAPAPADGTEIKIDKGGRVNEHGAEVVIPAGAFAKDLKIKIAKITDTSKLSLPEDGQLVSEVLEITKDEKGDFTKAVTITMTFDKSKIDSKAEIALYYYDPALKAWIKLDNIKVDWEKGTVSGEINHFTIFAVIAAGPEGKPDTPLPSVSTTLTDIAGHWAIDSIKTLLQKGAITGYPDQSFKPNNNITRAEFATVLVKAFNLEPGTGKNFDDTADHWAKNEIATAAAHGIVSGYSATAFGPNDNITREQMAVMIVKAAELSQTSAAPSFNDSNNIADWAEQSVAAASAAGIIKGYPDNTFLPQGQATRAEAATVIVKALE